MEAWLQSSLSGAAPWLAGGIIVLAGRALWAEFRLRRLEQWRSVQDDGAFQDFKEQVIDRLARIETKLDHRNGDH